MTQYISLKWDMEGQIKAFSNIWKVKDCNHRDLAWKIQNTFNFEHKNRCKWVTVEQDAYTYGHQIKIPIQQ